MMQTEIELIVQDILKSEEFKKGVRKIVEATIDAGIDATLINDLEGAVEDILSKGTFEVDTTVSFSS